MVDIKLGRSQLSSSSGTTDIKMNFETLMKLSQIASESELQDNSLAEKVTAKPQQIDFRDEFSSLKKENSYELSGV